MVAGIDILNTGHGHIEIRFDGKDATETARAGRIIRDMMARGYVLFIHGENEKLTRVEEFDEAKGVYVIADGADPEIAARSVSSAEIAAHPNKSLLARDYVTPPVKSRRGRPRKEVPIAQARVTAVGRSAGG